MAFKTTGIDREERKKRIRKTTRKIIHTFFKFFFIFLIVFLVLNVLFFTILGIYHRSKLSDEADDLVLVGKQIELDGHYFHLVTGGKTDAECTYVFLHSTRIVDDSIAFAPTWRLIEDKCAYAYLDRSGFGFSETTGNAKDIDSMLNETRSVLEKAGVKKPYILVPCGTAALEAFHWANKYPEEVLGIFGIGITFPEQFEGMTTIEYCGFTDWLMVRFFSVGGCRLVKGLKPTDYANIYTDKEMRTRNAVIYHGAYTQDMYEEDLAMVDNAAKVREEGWPTQIPIRLLYGNPIMEPYLSLDESKKETMDKVRKENPNTDYESLYYEDQRNFLSDKKNVSFVEIAGPSRVYTFNPDGVAKELLDFGNGLITEQK